jgi:DNA-binding MarR family transcriptional regulator
MRVLMFAGSKGEALATISEIVARFDISRGHVMKVVQALGRKGISRRSAAIKAAYGWRASRRRSISARSSAIWRRHSRSSAASNGRATAA